MTAVLGRGTCGGHVTLLFTVEDMDEDLIKQGSLGAGLCLNDGAEAIARGELGDYSLRSKTARWKWRFKDFPAGIRLA